MIPLEKSKEMIDRLVAEDIMLRESYLWQKNSIFVVGCSRKFAYRDPTTFNINSSRIQKTNQK